MPYCTSTERHPIRHPTRTEAYHPGPVSIVSCTPCSPTLSIQLSTVLPQRKYLSIRRNSAGFDSRKSFFILNIRGPLPPCSKPPSWFLNTASLPPLLFFPTCRTAAPNASYIWPSETSDRSFLSLTPSASSAAFPSDAAMRPYSPSSNSLRFLQQSRTLPASAKDVIAPPERAPTGRYYQEHLHRVNKFFHIGVANYLPYCPICRWMLFFLVPVFKTPLRAPQRGV